MTTTSTAVKLAGPDWVRHLRPGDLDGVCEAFARMAGDLAQLMAEVDRFTAADLPAEQVIEQVMDLGHRVEAAGQLAKSTARRVRTRAMLAHQRTEAVTA